MKKRASWLSGPLPFAPLLHAYLPCAVFASTDGLLPDRLLIGLDPRANPAECAQRVPGEAHRSGLCRNTLEDLMLVETDLSC